METTKTARKQEFCPISGEKINKDIHADYKGKRIYFCCPECPDMFMKNPENYMQKFREQGIQLEDAPKAEKPAAAGTGTAKH
ncbi:MAG TPA: YHS domain-containing protein [Planctomycetota bacterium]|nr:YHS domain-containing protein [Planctomycetota bacterium]